MAPFGLATAWLLGRLTRWRALIWALGPPLVLYAFHNWDLPVVACAVHRISARSNPAATLSPSTNGAREECFGGHIACRSVVRKTHGACRR